MNLEEIKDEILSKVATQKHDSSLHKWRTALANVVARNFRVKCYLDGRTRDIAFRGYKDDVAVAVEVYLYLYTLGNKLGSKAYHDKLAEGSGKGVYNSFVMGFLQGVEDGLNEQCTALMLVTPKEVEDEFEAYKEAQGMETKHVTHKISKNATFEKGIEEGKNAVKSRQLADKKKGKR